jgi:hypothetical protein
MATSSCSLWVCSAVGAVLALRSTHTHAPSSSPSCW